MLVRRQFVKDHSHADRESWNVLGRGIPDRLSIDTEIIVDEAASHARDFPSLNVGIRGPKLTSQVAHRLANNLHPIHDCTYPGFSYRHLASPKILFLRW